jgi:1,4-alpha-glucan branching enzyme
LCEAALDTYLPLLEALRTLESGDTVAPITLGITPVLANQLASPLFRKEMDAFFTQRLEACDQAPVSLEETGDQELLPLVDFWRERFLRLRGLFESLDGDLIGEFRRLEAETRLEIISSAATHGFLPLLGRDESIRLQLAVGAAEHRRIFGKTPRGCWVPECAYRPGGVWDPLPGTTTPVDRPGIEAFLTQAGFRYFFVDTHMAEAGKSLGWYGDIPHGTERFDAEFQGTVRSREAEAARSAYAAYLVGEPTGENELAAFVREPKASMQVWSRQQGYPGDGVYLEFHKIRWPGGIKYWSVTGPDVDLGGKEPYDPRTALYRASDHATHFSGFLGHIVRKERIDSSGVAMVPFDTELFGHWWFEGVDFLRELFGRLPFRDGVIPVTASEHLDSFPPRAAIQPLKGSWGANGDFSMWMNDGTRWTWERLWALEESFWDSAPRALSSVEARPVLAAAARQLLLAQSSDWQFMISTGAVPDYAERRMNLHCDDLETLLEALGPDAPEGSLARALERVSELQERDDLFPNILDTVEAVLGQS